MDHSILGAALKSREAYGIICAADYTFDDVGALMFKELGLYYDADPEAQKADPDIIHKRLDRKHPRHTELFDALLGGMQSSDVSVPNLTQEILEAKEDNIKLELSAAFANGASGRIAELLDEYKQIQDGILGRKQSEVVIGRSLMELEEEYPEGSRIKLLPVSMNTRLGGGAMRGNHIIVFGRPDAGKTTFVLNMAYGFTIKQGLRTLYVTNEDSEKVLRQRFYMRAIGSTMEYTKRNPQEVQDRAEAVGGKEFLIAHPDAGSVADISRWVDQYKPDVVIVDQMRNLVAHEESRVQQYEHIARDLRRLAIRSQVLVISLTQAGDIGRNELHLSMSHIDGSKTGIQGTADVIIGIGVNEEYLESGHRVLSFDKNKLSLDKDPLRVTMDLRHGKVT